MSTYAQIINGIVVNVIVADANFVAQSNLDYVLCTRGGIGWSFDGTNFIAPQPYPSWTLDENSDWQAPVARPTEGTWIWNEETQSWNEWSWA